MKPPTLKTSSKRPLGKGTRKATSDGLWQMAGDGRPPVRCCACSGAVVNGACLRCKKPAAPSSDAELREEAATYAKMNAVEAM